jgi:type I restriction enzyme S subunit
MKADMQDQIGAAMSGLEGWPKVRLRFKARLNPKSSIALEPTTTVSFIPMDAIGEDGSLRLDQTRIVSEVSQGYTYFEDDDVSIAKITPCFENGKGSVMERLIGGAGFGTTELIVLRPEEDVDARFLYYLTQSSHFRDPGEAAMLGAGGQKRVPDLYVKDFATAWPSRSVQSAIAAYLDAEAKRIDGLIEEKKNLLGSLTELKSTRITEIVTGQAFATQPTGDVWLPKIPNGWSLKRLKYLGQVRSGLAKGKKNDAGATTVERPYMRVANVQDGYIDLRDVAVIEVAENEVDRYTLKIGDILMNEGGDYDKVGRGAMWEGLVEECLHQNHVFAVRLDDVEWAPWLAAVTRTSYAKFYFMNNSKQSTNLASINQTNVKEFPVVLPPASKRDELLDTLTTDLKRIDALTQHVERELDVLAEFRYATITDAVLGRLDVSHHMKTE